MLLVDMREAVGHGLTIRPIRTMMNHATTELFFDDLEVPVDALVGEEGKGFRYLIDGLNAERILIAAECVGDGRWFIERATKYANDRVVFGRPIGQNQGVQFPIARAHVNVEAADLMRIRAAELFDRGEPCGAEANMAKLLAADASWEAANVAVQTHGGFGFAEDYDIERKFRETRLYQVAPISTNLILAYVAEHVLGPAAVVFACAPLDGITVVVARTGGRGAVCDAPARRPRRARDQDRTARRRRLRAQLRHDRQRAVELLRLAESIEGIADARSEAAGRAKPCSHGCSRRPMSSSRTSRPAPPTGSASRLRSLRDALPAPDRLQRLGLRLVGARTRRRRPTTCSFRARLGLVSLTGTPRRRLAGSASRSPTSPPACTPTRAS